MSQRNCNPEATLRVASATKTEASVSFYPIPKMTSRETLLCVPGIKFLSKSRPISGIASFYSSCTTHLSNFSSVYCLQRKFGSLSRASGKSSAPGTISRSYLLDERKLWFH